MWNNATIYTLQLRWQMEWLKWQTFYCSACNGSVYYCMENWTGWWNSNVGIVISHLLSMESDAFLLAGALPPFCPRPMGISPVASFVDTGAALTFFKCFTLWSCKMANHFLSATSRSWYWGLRRYFPWLRIACSTSLSCSSQSSWSFPMNWCKVQHKPKLMGEGIKRGFFTISSKGMEMIQLFLKSNQWWCEKQVGWNDFL